MARYALEGLPSKMMVANYRTVLPDAELLRKELENTRRLIESRGTLSSRQPYGFAETALSPHRRDQRKERVAKYVI